LPECCLEQVKRNADPPDRPHEKTKRCRGKSCGGSQQLLTNEVLGVERELSDEDTLADEVVTSRCKVSRNLGRVTLSP
jgi:hypothetical protein